MNYEEMNAAIKEAERTICAMDAVAERIAGLLVGRLRKVHSGYVLRCLKKELANYDMTTGRWKP